MMDAMSVSSSDIELLNGIVAHLRSIDCGAAADVLKRAIQTVQKAPATPANQYQKLVSVCHYCKVLPGEWREDPREPLTAGEIFMQFICDSCLRRLAEGVPLSTRAARG